MLSGNVLVAKLIPCHIEASMYAVFTGIFNLSKSFLAPQIGNFYNLFVGVTTDDLSQLWVLFAISMASSVVPLAFIWIVPKRAEVSMYQEVIGFVEKYPP